MTSTALPQDRAALEADQLAQLRRLVAELLGGNAFYGARLRAAGLGEGLRDLATFRSRMPFTTKDEIFADQCAHPPYGSHLTYPLERYNRLHQTSGTSGGQPLRWLDTPESWAWMLTVWRRVFATAGVTAADRILFPFSFGPFLGFWTAFEAALEMGCLALPGGGLGSRARLALLVDNGATALCCTPTYALRLAEVAAETGVDLPATSVRRIFVAGEPGGNVPAVRRRIEQAWGARVFDHHGMTEVGPVSYANPAHPDVLHVAESSYLAEVLDPESGEPVAPGQIGELVLTTLGRLGSPLLRYRTGDLVRPSRRSSTELGSVDLALEGGILARADDMVVVRGVNLYPSAVEEVVRRHPEVGEFQVELREEGSLAEVVVRVEPAAEGAKSAGALVRRLEAALLDRFQLRIPVESVTAGSLPRFELKARRWIRGASQS